MIGTVSGNFSIYMASGNVLFGTVNGSGAWSVADPPISGENGVVTMIIANGGVATRTWPTGTVWPAVSSGGPTLTASGTDIIHLMTINSGGTWYGAINIGYP